MRIVLRVGLVISIFVSWMSVNAQSKSDMNFLMTTLSQDNQRNVVLSGLIDFDELSVKLKKKMVAVGYKPGDMLPAKCVLRSLQSEEGVISVLISQAKDPASRNRKDWKKLGSFHPVLFDSMDEWRRRNEMKDPNYLEIQIAKLNDESAEVRKYAVDALGSIKGSRSVEPLITALNDENGDVRKAAVIELGLKKDRRALGPLIAKLIDISIGVRSDIRIGGRSRVEESLHQIDRNWPKTDEAKEAVPGLITALQENGSHYIRSSAAKALGQIQDPRSTEPLVAALKDEQWMVRENAAWALGKNMDPVAVEPLITALEDERYSVRKYSVLALGQLKDPRILEPLIGALKDENSEVRGNAVNALISLKDPRSVNLLISVMKDSSWTIQRGAKSALDKIDPDWIQTEAAKQLVPYFIDAMGKNHTPDFREMAVNALGFLQDPRAVEPLIAAMVDDDTTGVPWRAAYELGSIKDPRAVEPLIAAMLDTTLTPSVNLNAAIALGKLNDPRAVEPLISALKKEDKSDTFRQYVTRSLRNITRRGFAQDYDSWNNWWLENKETFLQEWQQKYSGEKK